MRTYLMGVLTVIAIGTSLIAFGLLAPQVSANPTAAPTTQAGYAAPASQPLPAAIRTAQYAPPMAHRAPRNIASSHRDWKKTALVIGGSTAAGAGLGGILGGGKGAAIGAAIGGGASTLLEALRR